LVQYQSIVSVLVLRQLKKNLNYYRARENVGYFASDFYTVFEPTPSETQHNERATLAHFSNSHLRHVSHSN